MNRQYYMTDLHHAVETKPLPDEIPTELGLDLASLVTAAWGDVDFSSEPAELGFRNQEHFDSVLQYFPEGVHMAIQMHSALEVFLAIHIREFIDCASNITAQFEHTEVES